MPLLKTTSGGLVRPTGGGLAVRTASGGGGAAKTLVTMDDLTFQGQIKATGAEYTGLALAIRYVGGERRFLVYDYITDWTKEDVGDLIEYKIVNALQTTDNIATVPVWTEVRRWSNWSNWPEALGTSYPIFKNDGGNGAKPAAFYWDETQGVLFYAWQPSYPGSERIFAPFGAVKLVDGEAGGNVSAGNRFGPWYFRNGTVADDFKDASCGLIPIPADRQASLGGKFLAVGHHCANIGAAGARGVGMWTVGDLPDVDPTPPSALSDLWPTAVHLYNTGSNAGVTPYSMRRPPSYYNATEIHISTTPYFVTAGGSYSHAAGSVGTTIGDCIYAGSWKSQRTDCVTILMSTGASGGAWQPEIWNGSAWVEATGWAVSQGDVALSGAVNIFYWPQVAFGQTQPHASMETAYYVRLRRVSTGTSGGICTRFHASTYAAVDGDPTGSRPEPVGGYMAPGTETYGPSNYGYTYSDYIYGGCFVSTDNVEGLVYFGSFYTGGVWYGVSELYGQPPGGGTPIYQVDSFVGLAGSNGNWGTGPQKSYMFTFDAGQMAECAANTRARNASGLNPAAYYDLRAETPGLSHHWTVPVAVNPYYGDVTDPLAGWGNCVAYDPIAQEIVMLVYNGTNNSIPLLAFWSVR